MDLGVGVVSFLFFFFFFLLFKFSQPTCAHLLNWYLFSTKSYLITNSCYYHSTPWPYDALRTSWKSREAQGQLLFTLKPAFELSIHNKNFRFFLRDETTLKEIMFVFREICTLPLNREWIKQLWCREIWGRGEDVLLEDFHYTFPN